MQYSKAPQRKKFDWVLTAIIALALFLYGWQCWKAGNANSFYTSAIKSMTMSFKNFFFASFDPAGYITVDKPPVALWFMAISAKIFGLHGWSIVLPSILFSTGSVFLIYKLVTPHFGRNAGRMAALIMTFTPIVVANARTNNMDATLMFFLLLALWFLDKAVQTSKTRWLLISFGLVGIGFNIKMLQAFMILPAMYFFYWIAGHENWKQKIIKTLLATLSLAVFTLALPITIDSIPASQRPYIGGSQHNSELELAFGYNGTQRLTGQSGGGGGAMPSGGKHKQPKGIPSGVKKKLSGEKIKAPKMGGNSKNGGGAFNIGTAGPFRLFQKELGPQISWLLPMAIIGLMFSLFAYKDRRRGWYELSEQQKNLLMWAGWLVPVYGFFSIAGFFHPYYMIMLAPPIAVMAGVGVTKLISEIRKSGIMSISGLTLVVGVILTGILQLWYAYEYYPRWTGILFGLIILLEVALVVLRNHQKLIRYGSIAAIIGIMVIPTWWSLTPTIAAESAGIPSAGPDLLSNKQGATGMGGGDMGNQLNIKLLNYLEKNQDGAKYLFATSSSQSAAPYIIKTGKAVMAMGGFQGSDPAITLKEFKQLVKTGQLKYFYGGGMMGGQGSSSSENSKIISWVKKNGKKVASSEYQDKTSKNNQPGQVSQTRKSRSTNKSKASGQMPNRPNKSSKQGPGFKGKGKPGKNLKQKPNPKQKVTGKQTSNSKPKQGMKQPQGPMGGGNQETLYDLSGIYK